eukprot:5607528-Prymnesium_polylepis.1
MRDGALRIARRLCGMRGCPWGAARHTAQTLHGGRDSDFGDSCAVFKLSEHVGKTLVASRAALQVDRTSRALSLSRARFNDAALTPRVP